MLTAQQKMMVDIAKKRITLMDIRKAGGIAPVQKAYKTTSTSKLTNTSKINFTPLSLAGKILNPANVPSIVGDFWSMVLGSKEQGGKTALGYLPVTVTQKDPNTGKLTTWSLPDILTKQVLPTQKQDPELKKEWESSSYPAIADPFKGITDFLGSAGKWILIGGVAIAGIWLIGKYIGKGK